MISGCTKTCIKYRRECSSCEDMAYDDMRIDFLRSNKCNCCVTLYVLEEGKYVENTTCKGGNTSIREYNSSCGFF